MIRAILFDMDGLLFDSERMGQEIFVRECERRGYPGSREFYLRLLGSSYSADLVLVRREYGPSFPYEEIMRIFREELDAAAIAGRMPVMPGAAECVAELKKMGLPLAIATGSETEHARIYLDHCPALRNSFDAMIGGEMCQAAKPSPDLYLAAARAIGISPGDCLGVEDSLNGVKALRTAGAVSVLIPDLIPFGPLFQPATDFVLPSLRELPALVRRLNSGGSLRA